MKSFLWRSIIGIFFGSFVSVIITCLLILNGQEMLSGHLFIKNSLGSMLCGWLCLVTPLYFENSKLTLVQATVYHFTTLFSGYILSVFCFKWIPASGVGIATSFFLFILVYLCIWLAFYFYSKNQMKKLNEQLNYFNVKKGGI